MKIMRKSGVLTVIVFVGLLAGILVLIKSNSHKSQQYPQNSRATKNRTSQNIESDPLYNDFSRDIEKGIISEEFLKERDPKEFIKLRWKTEAPYELTKRLYKPDSLPAFYRLLDDKEYAEYWPRIVEVISYISDNERSVPVILNYIRREDDWSSLDAGNISKRIGGKIASLRWIGLIGGKEADKTLRQAMTRDGAKELIKDWIDGPLPDWTSVYWEKEPNSRLVELIQGYAAIGGVLSQNQQTIQLVEKLHASLVEQHMGDGPRRPDLFCYLKEAKAIQKAIEELGFDEYRNRIGTTQLGIMISIYKDQMN